MPDPRFTELGGMSQEALANQVINMTQASLGIRPGSSNTWTTGLYNVYNTMKALYGADQGLSRFADWAGSAYQQPSYTRYQPPTYQQEIGRQLAPQIQTGYKAGVDPNALAADLYRQQADANSLIQFNNMPTPSGVGEFAYNPKQDMLPPTLPGLPGFG